MEQYHFPGTSPYPRMVRLWRPVGKPRALVLLSHGMAEHVDRYDHLGVFLSQKGFLLAGANHLGHGKEAPIPGWIGDSDGWSQLVEDLKRLLDWLQSIYPETPAVLLGHSMGSFLAREFVLRYPVSLNALVLSGTGWHPKALCAVGLLFAKTLCLFGKDRKPSSFLDKLAFSGNNKTFKTLSGTKFDWLSRDKEQVEKYIADPLCGFVFTAGGFRDLFTGLFALSDISRLRVLPETLAIYLLSGQKDPVGNFGKGVYQIASQYKNAGIGEVEVELYPDARHELFNEINKNQVMENLVKWLRRAIKDI